MKLSRVVLSGGGTGGHIYPALAVAGELRRRNPAVQIMYIGTSAGLEARLVPREELDFETLDIQGFRRSLSIHNLHTVRKFFRAVRVSKKLLRQFQPQVVLGTGGYVCGPVLYAASRLGLPTVIHEQNVIPGLTNRFLARRVDAVAVSFPKGEQAFPQARLVRYTGNPRATEVAQASKKKGLSFLGLADEAPVVLMVGGSRGARPLNEAFFAALPRLLKQREVHYVYVTGEIHYEEIKNQLSSAGLVAPNLHLYPFLHNMPDVLAAASVVISRAGASFLAELTALGVPALLVPSPYVTNNHQEKNAQWLVKEGAAAMLRESELSGEALAEVVEHWLSQPRLLDKMRQASLKLGDRQALYNLCGLMEQMAEQKR